MKSVNPRASTQKPAAFRLKHLSKEPRQTLPTARRLLKIKLTPLPLPLQPTNFILGRLIGVGSYGQVYQAMHSNSGDIVACKTIMLKFVNQDRIQKELTLLAQFKHKNVIKYLSHVITKEAIHIYQEYASLGSLTQMLTQFGPLPESIIREYCQQLLEGIEYLHKQQVLHLDLKSSNILVDSSGNLKISDFGCSKQLENSVCNPSVLQGSVPWMAPEVIRQETLNSAADIWSFGCVVLEMLRGTLPWTDQINFDNPNTAMLQIAMAEEPPTIPDCSSQLRDFLSQCLQLDPKMRTSIQQLKNHFFLLND